MEKKMTHYLKHIVDYWDLSKDKISIRVRKMIKKEEEERENHVEKQFLNEEKVSVENHDVEEDN